MLTSLIHKQRFAQACIAGNVGLGGKPAYQPGASGSSEQSDDARFIVQPIALGSWSQLGGVFQ